MPVPRRYTTDAIVLSRFDLGEADRVLTLITPGGGKLKAIAKGVRRPTSRLGGSLEPFAELNVALARGRTFDVVTEVRVGHAWLHLRDSLEPAATAWYLAELADRSLEERHAAEPLYALLRRAYELLDAGMAPGRVARWYEMHLADELGVRPELDRCVECDRVLEADETFRWVPPLGECCASAARAAAAGSPTRSSSQGLTASRHRGHRALRLAPDVERETEAALRALVRVAPRTRGPPAGVLDEVRRRIERGAPLASRSPRHHRRRRGAPAAAAAATGRDRGRAMAGGLRRTHDPALGRRIRRRTCPGPPCGHVGSPTSMPICSCGARSWTLGARPRRCPCPSRRTPAAWSAAATKSPATSTSSATRRPMVVSPTRSLAAGDLAAAPPVGNLTPAGKDAMAPVPWPQCHPLHRGPRGLRGGSAANPAITAGLPRSRARTLGRGPCNVEAAADVLGVLMIMLSHLFDTAFGGSRRVRGA
jgi:DNA repair protein RecO (recombination protein O)